MTARADAGDRLPRDAPARGSPPRSRRITKRKTELRESLPLTAFHQPHAQLDAESPREIRAFGQLSGAKWRAKPIRSNGVNVCSTVA